jgi:hypothetical protein
VNNVHKTDLKDARYLLKEAQSAGKTTQREMLQEARDIIDQVMREQSRD